MTVITQIKAAGKATGPTVGLFGSASVRTPCGPRRIENIRPGDMVVTRDEGLQVVRLVWSRTVTAAEIAADPSQAPVRLKPRAIGPMMPQRELVIAGAHRILVPGYRLADMPDTTACLIAARDVAGASDAAWVDKTIDEMTFYNLVFDSQQVFCANGLPVESFVPSKTSLPGLDAKVAVAIEQLFNAEESQAMPVPAHKYSAPEAKDYRPEFV